MAADAALDALYQEIILDHNRRPRNFRELPNATCSADGKNPNCGDALTIWLQFDGDTVADVSFQGVGCAISKASASLMTLAVKGRTRTEAAAIFEKVHNLVTGTATDAETSKELGQLRALGGVSKFPMRVKCASLAWHALKSAMDDSEPVVAVHTGERFALVAGLSAADVAAGDLMPAKHPNGTALCVGRHAGALFAVKDSCPHAEFPLSEGTLYPNGELECCWHGARFDCRTGAVLRGPAEEPLVRYEVEERDGGIWVRRAR